MSNTAILTQLQKKLSTIYDDRELQSIAKLIGEHKRVNDPQWKKDVIERLGNNEPIQYILGYAWFYDLKLGVNKHVLIPRQETEELVAWVVKDCKKKQNISVLDIGTGSGCIALSLANNLTSPNILATDVSQQALELAKSNSRKLKIRGVKFLRDNILSTKLNDGKFDIIISNPPYIRKQDRKLVASNVLDYEPHIALFVNGKDPLLFYKEIALFAKTHLSAKGNLYFEVNQFTGKTLQEWLLKDGWHVDLRKDLNDNWRMLKAIRN